MRTLIPLLALIVLDACTGDRIAGLLGTLDTAAAAPYTVGVYYYPWHGDDFHGGRYLRQRLVPPQVPTLGQYDDRSPTVIAQHLTWSRQANVSLWVASWWGPDSREDRTLRQHILPHAELGDLRLAIHYETQGRSRDFSDLNRLQADINHLATHYFDHPSYYRIDGRPVVFVYLTRVLATRDLLAEAVTTMRQAADQSGHQIYIVGDHVFGRPPSNSRQMDLLDAVTNYDVYGSMGARGYAGQTAVDAYYHAQEGWRQAAHRAGAAFIPAATPGFNDKAVRDGHQALARRLDAHAAPGSLFEAMLTRARGLTDSATGRLLLVTSWNEWHEDTQIEPVLPAPPTTADDSPTGTGLTNGLPYEGYSEDYLDILRRLTRP